MPDVAILTIRETDDDPLGWVFDVAPAGMSIDLELGTLRWTPTHEQLGENEVLIRVLDGQGCFASLG